MLSVDVPNVPLPLVFIGVCVGYVLHIYMPLLISTITTAVMAIRTSPSFTFQRCSAFPIHVCTTTEFTTERIARVLTSYAALEVRKDEELFGKQIVQVSYNKGHILSFVVLAVLACTIGVVVLGCLHAFQWIFDHQNVLPVSQDSHIPENACKPDVNDGEVQQPPTGNDAAVDQFPQSSHTDTTGVIAGLEVDGMHYKVRTEMWNTADNDALEALGICRMPGPVASSTESDGMHYTVRTGMWHTADDDALEALGICRVPVPEPLSTSSNYIAAARDIDFAAREESASLNMPHTVADLDKFRQLNIPRRLNAVPSSTLSSVASSPHPLPAGPSIRSSDSLDMWREFADNTLEQMGIRRGLNAVPSSTLSTLPSFASLPDEGIGSSDSIDTLPSLPSWPDVRDASVDVVGFWQARAPHALPSLRSFSASPDNSIATETDDETPDTFPNYVPSCPRLPNVSSEGEEESETVFSDSN